MLLGSLDTNLIIVNNARHSVCGGGELKEANYHCYFSFQSPKNSTREDRAALLNILFDSMRERVEDAHNGVFY